MKIFFSTCLAVLSFSMLQSCSTMCSKISATPGAMTPEKLNWSVVHAGTTEYYVYLPTGYAADTTTRWPLMLFLHGAGERGTNLQQVLVHGPLKLVKQGRQFPFIIAAPQCPANQVWDDDSVMQVLDRATHDLRVDAQRIYLVGLSMGGYETWRLGVRHADKFAAIVPISGGGDLLDIILATPEQSAALKRLPIWAFHGGKDPVVPLNESERTVDFLKQHGYSNVKLTVYPEAQHDAWTATFESPALYTWLLQHHLPQPATK